MNDLSTLTREELVARCRQLGSTKTRFGTLNPCPMCGGRPRLLDYSSWWVECENGCEHPNPPSDVEPSADKTVNWWNTRTAPVHGDHGPMVLVDGYWRCELWVGSGVCGATRV
jgi:hypothetical protein